MSVQEKIADGRRVAQPAGEDWTHRQIRVISIFLSVPLANVGVPANLITMTWTVLGALGVIALGFPHYWVRVGGACLLVSSRLLDYVDGEVARLSGRTSNRGVFLDTVGHDVIQRSLFLPLGYAIFRSTTNAAYLLCALSASVFVGSYQTAPFIAEYAGLGDLPRDQGSIWRSRTAALLRKAVQPFYFLMKQTTALIFLGAISDRLSWTLLYYAITAPVLFLWRVWRLSHRLKRDRQSV